MRVFLVHKRSAERSGSNEERITMETVLADAKEMPPKISKLYQIAAALTL